MNNMNVKHWVFYNGPETWQATGRYEDEGFPDGENINLGMFGCDPRFLVPGDLGFDEIKAIITWSGEKAGEHTKGAPLYFRFKMSARELIELMGEDSPHAEALRREYAD